jgi:hypothetical protein
MLPAHLLEQRSCPGVVRGSLRSTLRRASEPQTGSAGRTSGGARCRPGRVRTCCGQHRGGDCRDYSGHRNRSRTHAGREQTKTRRSETPPTWIGRRQLSRMRDSARYRASICESRFRRSSLSGRIPSAIPEGHRASRSGLHLRANPMVSEQGPRATSTAEWAADSHRNLEHTVLCALRCRQRHSSGSRWCRQPDECCLADKASGRAS